MTTFDYARSKATADRLIAKFGQAATLLVPKNTGTSYNPTMGAPDRHDVTVVVTDYKTSEVDGARILAMDRKVLQAVGKLVIVPTPAHKLEIGGVAHAIVNVIPLNPGGTIVLYEMQCRR